MLVFVWRIQDFPCDSLLGYLNIIMLVIRNGDYLIGTALANSVKFSGIRPRMYIRIYFDNAGDNVTLTLYNVETNVNTITSVIAAKQTA